MAKTITIGRNKNNDLVLESPQVSAFHALVTLIDETHYQFNIKDLGSTNGTFVNGNKVRETEFKIEDEVTIVNITLKPSQYLPFFYPVNVVTALELPIIDGTVKSSANHETSYHQKDNGLNLNEQPPKSDKAVKIRVAPSQAPNNLAEIAADKADGAKSQIDKFPGHPSILEKSSRQSDAADIVSTIAPSSSRDLRRKSMSWISSQTRNIVLHFVFFLLGGVTAIAFASGISTTPLLGILGYLLLFGTITLISVSVFSSLQRFDYQARQQKAASNLWEAKVATMLVRQSESERDKHTWNGFRKFEIKQKKRECRGIYSFYLVPHDRKPMPSFRPGQYLTFRLKIDGHNKPLIRCYSLSQSPAKTDYFRVTIKHLVPPLENLDAPPGLSSSYFCENLKEGDFLDVKAPNGHFFLDSRENTPVVLLGGGIGVTPLISMLESIVDWNPTRETWFFYGVRNRGELIIESHLQEIARNHDNIHLHVCFSDPGADDKLSKNYRAERISVNLLKRLLPSNNYRFYLCGPPPMMRSLKTELEDWEVPESNIHFEAFGPASVKTAALAPSVSANEQDQSSQALEVHFVKSGKVHTWTPEVGSLLDLAEKHSVAIDFGCRAGNCGTCTVAIRKGTVKYLSEPGEMPEEGSCLTCICKPSSRLSLDA